MMTARESLEQWLRRGQDPVAATIRRAATSALGTYGAYVGYGLFHAALRVPHRGPEASQALPGDELIAAPHSTKTFAIDLAVPPAAVWPYLVQMGYGRAGWYGWYPMENGGQGSVDGILEEWQDLTIGDVIPDGPRADDGFGVWRVVDLDAPTTLVLYSRRVALTGRELELGEPADEPAVECSWAFVLRPEGAGSRLVIRVRVRFLAMDSGLLGDLTRRFFDLGDTVMEWTMLDGIKARAERIALMPAIDTTVSEVRIPCAGGEIFGTLSIPRAARGVVLFVHDGGSRHRLRNLRVAWSLQTRGFATLILDVHTPGALARDGSFAYDIDRLAARIADATAWLHGAPRIGALPVAYVAASAGAAAALTAAALRPRDVAAIVAFSARFDLGGTTAGVRAPTLLIVGADAEDTMAANRVALADLPDGSRLEAIAGAQHLFEEHGVLDRVCQLAGDWFDTHVVAVGAEGGQLEQRAE